MDNLPQSNSKTRILIADDEPDIGEVLSSVAEDLGFYVTYVQDGKQVVPQTNSIDPEVIMLDLRMPGADGVEIIRELARMSCKANIILVSGLDQRTLNTVEQLGREKNLHMVGTLIKPVHPDSIEELLKPLIESSAESGDENVMPVDADSGNQLGPLVLYELQTPLSNTSAGRWRAMIDCCWRMDDGELILGKRLSKWSESQGVSKGMLNFYLREAMRQWQCLHSRSPNLELVFNIDSILLQDVHVTDFLVDIVEHFSVPHDVLVLETSLEGVRAAESEAIDILARLQINGFKIALETEGQNDEELLINLDKLPMDEIVIDMGRLNAEGAFSNEIELEFQFSSLTSVIRRKGLESCAINVNTQRVLKLAQGCGFDWARGRMAGEPLPASGLQRVLTSN